MTPRTGLQAAGERLGPLRRTTASRWSTRSAPTTTAPAGSSWPGALGCWTATVRPSTWAAVQDATSQPPARDQLAGGVHGVDGFAGLDEQSRGAVHRHRSVVHIAWHDVRLATAEHYLAVSQSRESQADLARLRVAPPGGSPSVLATRPSQSFGVATLRGDRARRRCTGSPRARGPGLLHLRQDADEVNWLSQQAILPRNAGRRAACR